jgi:hypothetical protein
MVVAPLVVLVALTVAPAAGPDPTALVAKLGSADPSERASAIESLKVLGREALPSLEKAMKADDARLREGASILWETIERNLMSRASTVRLDSLDRPREAILGDLEKQTGLTLHLDQGSRDEPIADREPATVPFWSAIERLGLRGVYHDDTGEGKFPRLGLRNDPAYQFNANAGAFRISLTGLHLHRDNRLIHPPWVRIDRFGQRINVTSKDFQAESVTFFGGLDLMVEPRMWFTQEAPARLIEAVDDLGQSLVPEEAEPDQKLSDNAHFAFYGGSGVTRVSTEFRLRPVEKLGRTARLRGVVPVMLHLRRPEPTLVIPLADAAGKSFRQGSGVVRIEKVSAREPGNTSVNLILGEDANPPDRTRTSNGPQTDDLADFPRDRIEFEDAEGHLLNWQLIGFPSATTNGELRVQIFVSGVAPPARLRVYRLLRLAVEIPFALVDVPSP